MVVGPRCGHRKWLRTPNDVIITTDVRSLKDLLKHNGKGITKVLDRVTGTKTEPGILP